MGREIPGAVTQAANTVTHLRAALDKAEAVLAGLMDLHEIKPDRMDPAEVKAQLARIGINIVGEPPPGEDDWPFDPATAAENDTGDDIPF